MTELFAKPDLRDCLQPLKTYVPGKSHEDVAGKYAPARISKLGSNENPLGPGLKARESVKHQAANLSIYPDATCSDLREALAAYTGKRPVNFFLGNGSDEVLLLIAAAYLNPDDKVLISSHTFFNYEFVSRVFDGEVLAVPTRDLHYDLPAFYSAAMDTRAKMVFLCNPNNPTGLYFTHSQLEVFLASMPRDTLIVVDEAYREYADAPDFPDTAALMEEFPNLVVTRTFSKAHGLAALRVGYAMASESIIKDLKRAKMPFNVNLLAQKAAVAALRDVDHIEKSIRMNRAGKMVLQAELAALGCRVLPSQGNFLCFEPPKPAAEVCEAMFRQGVIVRPLGHFGMPSWARVTVGTPDQIGHFLEAITAALR